MPKSHQLQGMASRGKFPLRGTIYTTDCAYEKQSLFLRVAEEAIATKRTADDVLISLPQGRHTPHGSHAYAKGVTYPSDSDHRGHYPTTCMDQVKQVKQRPILAWYLCHLCTRLAVGRLPQMSN